MIGISEFSALLNITITINNQIADTLHRIDTVPRQ